MAYLMGIDLGTSSLKVVVMREDGKIEAICAENYQYDSPVNGYGEQDIQVWWNACKNCLQQAVGKLGAKVPEIAGIGFSGQMHGVVFLDKDKKQVRPAILHTDARSAKQVGYINEKLGRPWVEDTLLNPVYTGFMLPSLLWVRDNEPENFEKICYIMLPKDYIRFMLCGEIGSDYSDASATLAFDIERMDWSDATLEAFGLTRDIFPACTGTDQLVGTVTQAAADLTGLKAGTKVVAGGGDAVMQAVGNGAILPGQATANIGTSGQVCFQTNRVIKNPELNTNTFCGYDKGHWITMGATMSAGLSMKWFGSLFPELDYKELDSQAEKEPAGSGGLLFLPYLTGERTPHLNPNISGMFWGITTNASRARLAKAVMEGVAYSLRECLELCGNLGLKNDQLIASGGGAQSPLWLQIQSDIYGAIVKVADIKEHAGVGAAIVAGVGAGVYQNIQEGCQKVVRYKDKVYYPNSENLAIYNEYFALFKQAYQSSREVLEKVTLLGRR